MDYGSYQFRAVFKDEAVLPPYKGSTFRGVFGRALKAVTCALRREDCTTCLLRQQCVYAKVFEVLASDERGRPSPPHPFVIEPPITLQTHFTAGEAFDFSLLLFGRANQYLPYFVYAFEQMGEIGVGRHVRGKRAQFQLLEVINSETDVIYKAEDQSLLHSKPVNLLLEEIEPGDLQEVTVRLITPLRLKYQEHLHSELPFHILIRAVLRRIAVLNKWFGNGEPQMDYKGLVARAHNVETLESTIRWFDWERYSFRQKSRMDLGGMVGRATYRGNGATLQEFLPLLRYAEIVHIGKASTFGLGKIRVVED
jgi:CRISPR/Cas system endoribonuclease Cas6 (RAMP superfamily)